jgi:hypothetical protein
MHGHPLDPPPLPKRGSGLYRRFVQMNEQLIGNLGIQRALYLWYAVRDGKEPEFIYVGESCKDVNGLRGRLGNHFKQGYHIFWMTAFHTQRYVNEVIALYSGKDYTADVTNQTLRHGVTHIVFCGEIEQGLDITHVAKDLIQLFGNPRGNVKDKRTVPFPINELSPLSIDIRERFMALARETIPYEF